MEGAKRWENVCSRATEVQRNCVASPVLSGKSAVSGGVNLLDSHVALVSWKQHCYLFANTTVCFLKRIFKGHTVITNKLN